MGKIIAITGGKGGCGKTVLTAALASALAGMSKKTCAVDMCVGMRGLDMALGAHDKVVFDFGDFCEEGSAMEQMLLSIRENLWMIAAPQLDVSAEITAKALQKALDRLRKRFDYVLLDTACVLTPFHRSVCKAADEVILVTLPGDAASRNTERASAVLREDSDAPQHLIMNFYGLTPAGGDCPPPDAVATYLDIPLIGVVPAADWLEGRLPEQYPPKVREAIGQVAQRLDGRQIPFGRLKTRRFPWLG